MRAWTRSIAAPALRSAAISASSLRMRSSRMIGPARDWAPPIALPSLMVCRAGIMSATATRVPFSAPLTNAYGSSPSTHVTTSTPSSSVGIAA